MRASVNLKPCELPDGLSTFDDLVEHVEESCMPSGHVITRIVVDGDELDEQEESRSGERSLDSIGVVEFYSAKPLDLARDGLKDALELLPSLCEDIASTAKELRAGDVREGLGMLYECSGILDWYINLLNAIDRLYIHSGGRGLPEHSNGLNAGDGLADSLEAADDTMGSLDGDMDAALEGGAGSLKSFSALDNFRDKLIEIEDAESRQDILLLADLLEYELLPLVRIWSNEVPALIGRMNYLGGEA